MLLKSMKVFALGLGVLGFGFSARAGVCSRNADVVKALEAAVGRNCNLIFPMDLEKIQKLQVYLMNGDGLDGSDFTGLSSLEVLDIDGQVKVALSSDFFRGLSRIQIFNIGLLHQSRMETSLPGAFLPAPKTLKSLNLKGVEVLQSGMFSGMDALRDLRFFDMKPPQRLPARLLAGLPALDLLYLEIEGSREVVNEVSEDLFEGAPAALTMIELYFGRISSMPAKLLKPIPEIPAVLIDFDAVDGLIPVGFLDESKGLRYLDLDSQADLHLPAGLFRETRALANLLLDARKLSGLTDEMFAMTQLLGLRVNVEHIESIPAGLLKGLPRLETIAFWSLRDGPETLSPGFLSDLPNLERVTLSFELRNLPLKFFEAHPKLRRISLEYNVLRELDPALFTVVPRLETVRLVGNPLSEPAKDRLKRALGDKVTFD